MPSIPSNALPGDYFLVSFDGADPNLSDPAYWAQHGGLIRIGQWLNGNGFDQYEHAAIYIGGGQIVEAQNTGTAYANVSKYANLDTFWSTGILKPTANQRSAIVAAARGYVGVPYSWPDYWALAAKRLNLGWLVPGLQSYVASTKHMICSQVVDQCWHDAGIELFQDKRWPGYVTPGDLYERLTGREKIKLA